MLLVVVNHDIMNHGNYEPCCNELCNNIILYFQAEGVPQEVTESIYLCTDSKCV